MSNEKFTAENSAMLLIDHQIGTMSWIRSLTFDEIKANALVLAKAAKILGIPVILTSSMEEHAQGPLLEEFQTILPEEYAARIKRAGIVNAMSDKKFADAVMATKRKKLLVAGVTNDVCTVYPVLTALESGYAVQVIADAGGSPTQIADEMALRRMDKAGAIITTTNQLIAELTRDWSTEKGSKVLKVLIEDIFSKMG